VTLVVLAVKDLDFAVDACRAGDPMVARQQRAIKVLGESDI
jgi:hypothetical protein